MSSSELCYPSILVPLSSCDKTSWTGRKGCFSCQLTDHHAGKPRQETKAGTWRQGGKKPWSNTAHWLVLQVHIQLSFLYSLGPLDKGWAPLAMGSTLPHQLRKCPVDLPAHQSDGGIFPEEIFSSQMTLSSVKLTIRNKTKQTNKT